MRSEVRIILCGGTGVGKSAVGNKILGSKQFVCGTRPHPITRVCDTGTTVIRGRKITVVDTPSTEEPELEAEFQRCVNFSESPPADIFLLVTPLGCGGGKPLRVLNTLQTVFSGRDDVDDFTIVLFTGGDRLEELSQKHEGDDELKTLLGRCGNRQHTFNNEVDDQAEVRQLLVTINRLLQKRRNGHVKDEANNANSKKRSVEEAEEEEDIWNWPEYKAQLPVTCGNRRGVLHRDKMAKGEKCIEVQGSWFTPTKFEVFAGKGTNKKWKQSIRCRDVPLAQLILDGHLSWSSFLKKEGLNGDQDEFPMWAPDGSLIESDDFQLILGVEGELQDGIPKEKPLGENATIDDIKMPAPQEASLTATCRKVERTAQKNHSPTSSGKKEDASHRNKGRTSSLKQDAFNETGTKESLDMAVFQDSQLPVTCGAMKGILQKNRFSSGSTGKCIRTVGCWLTPEKFVQEGAGLKSRKWRRDIQCHGKPLAILIEKGILNLHSLFCECEVCKSEDPADQNNDDHCFICGQDTELVCCDGCPRSFHHDCHLPPLSQKNLGDRWMCTFCIVEKSQELCHRTRTLEEALGSAILPNMLLCQYLLLYLLKEDEQLVFMQDPCLTLDHYAAVISKPMWLDKIIKKLRSEYTTVGQFVADVQLIFDNCTTFNKNNEYGKMGARLKDLFEKKFRNVFSIQ